MSDEGVSGGFALLVGRVARRLGRPGVEVPVEVPAGVAFVRSGWVTRLAGRLAGMGSPAAAVTLGRTVLVAPGVEVGERLARHELAHVAQWEREGAAFPFRYAWAHIRHGYGDNPYEAEARAAETGRSESGEDDA